MKDPTGPNRETIPVLFAAWRRHACEDKGRLGVTGKRRQSGPIDREDAVAVYLKVAPRDSRLGPSGAHTLSGSECLVFYLGGTPSSRSRHPGTVNVLLCDGSVRYAKDLDAIATELARMPARNVSTIILGPSSQTGYVTTRWELTPDSKQAPALGLTGAGGSAVMIGLLLPAVQAAREAARTKARSSVRIQTLKSLVGPAGHAFVVDNDDTLLPL